MLLTLLSACTHLDRRAGEDVCLFLFAVEACRMYEISSNRAQRRARDIRQDTSVRVEERTVF